MPKIPFARHRKFTGAFAARALGLASLLAGLFTLAGCGAPAIDAQFQPSAQDDRFGTIVDDRGTFEFVRDPVTGNLVRVNATGGQIILPTDGQDISVQRDDGGGLTISPQGAEEVIIAVRDDPTGMDLDVEVARESLGDLGAVVRQPSQSDELCEANQSFLDASCVPLNRVDIDAVAASIFADLQARGETSLTEDAVRALLERYVTLPVNCCMAWAEFRSNGGEACADD